MFVASLSNKSGLLRKQFAWFGQKKRSSFATAMKEQNNVELNFCFAQKNPTLSIVKVNDLQGLRPVRVRRLDQVTFQGQWRPLTESVTLHAYIINSTDAKTVKICNLNQFWILYMIIESTTPYRESLTKTQPWLSLRKGVFKCNILW